MKLKSLILVCVLAFAAASCSKDRYTAEGLAIPVVHAVQQNDAGDLVCLMPGENFINEIWEPNSAALGGNYNNKYTRSYRKDALIANAETDLEIIKNISETNSLNWDEVALGKVETKEVIDSMQNFTWVTTNLRFTNGDYQMRYKAAQHKGIWYLLGDIDFAQSIPY